MPKLEGHIYVFTFSHFLDEKSKDPNYLRLVDAAERRGPDISNSSKFNSKSTVLIKIGYTTQTPKKRLAQWKATCGQSGFVLLTPGFNFPIKKRGGLSNLFKSLKIKDQITLKHVNKGGDGFWSSEAYKSEQNIHSIVRKKFGSGRMFCDGCKSSPKKSGVHHEWFLIPRDSLDEIWRIIDSNV